MMKNIYLNRLESIAELYNIGAGNHKTNGFIFVGNENTGGS